MLLRMVLWEARTPLAVSYGTFFPFPSSSSYLLHILIGFPSSNVVRPGRTDGLLRRFVTHSVS